MKKIGILIISLAFTACGNVQRVDTAAVKQKMGDYKIKKINQEEIQNQVNLLGSSYAKAIAQTNVCDSTLAIKEANTVRLLNNEELSKGLNLTGKAKETMEALSYGVTHGEDIVLNTQRINDTTYMFSFSLTKLKPGLNPCKKTIGLVFFERAKIIKSL